MATRLQDLTDQQVLDIYNTYFETNSSNWSLGLNMLLEMSRRDNKHQDREFFVRGLRRIISIKPSLQGREEDFFPRNFIIPIEEVKAIVEEMTRDVCIVHVDNINLAQSGQSALPTMKYQLPVIRDIEQFSTQVNALLGECRGLFHDMSSKRLLTFGSCFAVNIGRTLRERDASVYTLVIAEDVNSPFNNVQFLRRVFLGTETLITEELEILSSINYDAIKAEFHKATDIVFTLGNIFHLEVDGQATLFATQGLADVVEESFDQTISCLKEMFYLLTENTQARILVSVSPIPILGYRGNSFSSAIEADCFSKSQLRAALHASMREFPRVKYVPTFEIFRWLPAHEAFATFGVEDGNSRHIDQTLLNSVLDSIIGVDSQKT